MAPGNPGHASGHGLPDAALGGVPGPSPPMAPGEGPCRARKLSLILLIGDLDELASSGPPPDQEAVPHHEEAAWYVPDIIVCMVRARQIVCMVRARHHRMHGTCPTSSYAWYAPDIIIVCMVRARRPSHLDQHGPIIANIPSHHHHSQPSPSFPAITIIPNHRHPSCPCTCTSVHEHDCLICRGGI